MPPARSLPRAALALLVPAALLAAAPGCAGMTENHRRGMMFVGGAAVIVGAVMVGDGLSCDVRSGGAGVCDDDRQMMWAGLATMTGGLVAAGIGAYLQREADRAAD